MGDTGTEIEHIELVPMPDDIPAPEIVPALEPAAPEPDKVLVDAAVARVLASLPDFTWHASGYLT